MAHARLFEAALIYTWSSHKGPFRNWSWALGFQVGCSQRRQGGATRRRGRHPEMAQAGQFASPVAQDRDMSQVELGSSRGSYECVCVCVCVQLFFSAVRQAGLAI